MENFFTKKVQNVFAILKKKNNKEEGDNTRCENKTNKSDKDGMHPKDTSTLDSLSTEKKGLKNDIIISSDKIENRSTEEKENTDHNVNKKRKLMKLHNNENVYLIDNFINIKKCSETNYTNEEDMKKIGTTITPITFGTSSSASMVTLNTTSICNFLLPKKGEKGEKDEKDEKSEKNEEDKNEKKKKTLEPSPINSNEQNNDDIVQAEGGLEQTPAINSGDIIEIVDDLNEGKETNLIHITHVNPKEREEKSINEKKKNNQKEQQKAYGFLKSTMEKKNTKIKKQKTNHSISSINNSNQKENSNFMKNNGDGKRVNRIDEIFKSLIIEQNEKKEKQLNNSKSDNISDQMIHISTTDCISIIDEIEIDHKITDETTQEANEHTPNGTMGTITNRTVSSNHETIAKKKTPEWDGENGSLCTRGKEFKGGGSLKIECNHINSKALIIDTGADEQLKGLAQKETKEIIKNTQDEEINISTGRIEESEKIDIQTEISCMGEDIKTNETKVKDEQKLNVQIENEKSEFERDQKYKWKENNKNSLKFEHNKNETYDTDNLRTKFPEFAMDQSKKLINETNEFFNMYNLNLKIEHLPINIPDDLKALIEKKRKIVNTINDYKNELKEKRNISKRDEKYIKIKSQHGDALNTNLDVSKIESDCDKKENKNEPTINNHVTHNDEGDVLENAKHFITCLKSEEAMPELSDIEEKTINNNMKEFPKCKDLDIDKCETDVDESELVHITTNDKNNISCIETLNHPEDIFNEDEMKKGNSRLNIKKKRKPDDKKVEKVSNSFDDLNYLGDSDKEIVEREYNNFLNVFAKMNMGNCSKECDTNEVHEQSDMKNLNEFAEPTEAKDQSENIPSDEKDEASIVDKNITNYDKCKVNIIESGNVEKEEFIKNVMKSLTMNSNEEENYLKYKKIKNEEIKFKKLKKIITEIKIKEKKIDVLLSNHRNFFKYTNMYRHRHFLHEKMLINWSYVENIINKKNDIRNRNLPFQLLELDENLAENIQKTYDDILLDDFSGIIITLNTNSFSTAVDGNSIHISKIICGCLVEYLSTSELNIKCIWAHPFLSAKSTYHILCAFLPRAILEAFLNNNTCSENNSTHKQLFNSSCIEKQDQKDEIQEKESKQKRKKSFYDRLHQLKESNSNDPKKYNKSQNHYTNEEECYFSNFAAQQYPATYFLNFNKEWATLLNNSADSSGEYLNSRNEHSRPHTYPTWNTNDMDKETEGENKLNVKNGGNFLYIIFSDIDIFPRQCYLLLCSYKYMCLNMHYDTDCYSEHYDLDLKNIQKENIGKTTELSNVCPCSSIKNTNSDAEESYERIIGCSELYMYYMIPKKEERESLGLLKRKGWRDLISTTFDEDIHENISRIVKIRTNINNLYDHISMQNKLCEKIYNSTYINKYEWCGLKIKDIRNMMNEDFNFESPKKK
ncbi:hypothetical protein, conserved [Plasmodium gonderi]|uniref:Uncharacterized protein n=1 Tax=Plasmodium gonderi TaxID=77519 RepID=A0A1Y1JHH4_PLAGO|nr:hypothetical protein, conserved [Plasmodium gonderi]GAW81098.1 hypothetical protein, conserved [Plasmodium gonderi]